MTARNLALAGLGGLLGAASFPNPAHIGMDWPAGWLSFVCLVPLLAVRESRGWKWSMLWGGVWGLVFYGILVVWVAQMPALAPFGLVAWACLVAYMALFPAVFLAGTHAAVKSGMPDWVAVVLLFTLAEYLRNHLLSGFPWGVLGSAHTRNPLMLAVAPVIGMHGMTGLTAGVNATVYVALRHVCPGWAGNTRPSITGPADSGRRIRLLLVGGLLLAVGLMAVAEHFALQRQATLPQITVAGLQGNVNQNQTWDRTYQQHTLEVFHDLFEAGAEQGARLAVWPETAFPGIFSLDRNLAGDVRSWSLERGIAQLIGTDEVERAGQEYDYYNAAVLIDRRGRTRGLTAKGHLVPIGEYIPWKDGIFFFIHKVVRRYGGAGFTPGRERHLLRWEPEEGYEVPVGTLICFESIFPQYAAWLTRRGSRLLVVITYDTWFGRTAAPAQHAMMSALRAAENARWLVRVAASGISAVFAPDGRLDRALPLDERGLLLAQVQPLDRRTAYTRFGDWMIGVCVLWLAVELGMIIRTHRRAVRNSGQAA